MSTINLVLLGMLLEKPYSAYDLHKQIEFRNLAHWVKVGKATVFRNVVDLEKKGFLESVCMKDGNMPVKTVYTITEKGKEHFYYLLQETAKQPAPILFPMNAIIANLNKIPKDEAVIILDEIKNNLIQSKKFIEGMQPERAEIPFVGKSIMKQQVLVLETLITWLDNFSADFFD